MTRKNESITLSVPQEMKQALEQIAIKNDCFYGAKPSISALIKMIALGELTVTKPRNEISEAIASIQSSLNELSKSI